MKKVAIYIRVSTEEQAKEGYSIQGQKDKLVAYCKLRDWLIEDIYIDGGFSGTNIDRPALQKLLQNLNNFDTVLVYKLDRLSRNQRDILYLVEEKFLENDIDFVSILENFDTSTPFGRAMMGILAVFAQLERDTIVERTKMGKERRAKEGYWNGGPAPIGYDLIDGRLIINEFEALQIKELFKLYKKYGQNKTAYMLNKKGMKTKYGEWHGRSIQRIVTNPIYTGKVKYKDEVFEGVHDAIISEKEFNEIQDIIKKRTNNSTKKSKYLLGGLCWCGHCKARLKSMWSKSSSGNKNHYYVCYSVAKRPIHMVKDVNCPGKYWRMEELESEVLKKIKKIKFNKEKFIKAYEERKTDTKIDERKIVQNKIKDIEKQIDKLMDLYQLDKIPAKTISERIEKLYNEKKSLQNALDSFVEAAANDDIIEIEALLKLIDNFDKIWAEANFEERRLLLQSLIKKIIVTDKVDIIWNLSHKL